MALILGTAGNDTLGGGATGANDLVSAGNGADRLQYVLATNGGDDLYLGGQGIDILELRFTTAEFNMPFFAAQALNLQALVAAAPKLAGQVAPGTTWLPKLNFGGKMMQAYEVESVEIYVDGVLYTGNLPVTITSAAQAGAVQEDGTLVVGGVVGFADNDFAQAHTPTVTAPGGAIGSLVLSGLSESALDAPGTVNWTYTLNNAAAQYLTAGQTKIETFIVNIDDGNGSIASQAVTITITGQDDVVVASTGTVTEDRTGNPNVPGNSPISASYPLAALPGDPVGAGDIPANAVWFQNTALVGSVVVVDTPNPDPAPIPLANLGTLSFVGNVWTYTLNNTVANPLAGGQNPVLPFSVSAQWTHPTLGLVTVVRPLTVIVNGVNDDSTMTRVLVGEDLTVAENGGFLNNLLSLDPAAGGNINVVDPDGNFPGNAQVTNYGNFAALGDGSWTYNLNQGDPDVQAIPAGATVIDTINFSYDGASVQIPITIIGADDLPSAIFITDTVTPPAVLSPDSPTELVGGARASHYDFRVNELGGINNATQTVPADGSTAGGTLRNDDPDSPQTFKALTSTPLNGLGNRVDDTSSIGKYGTFALNTATGVWTYTLNDTLAATEALNVGDIVQERLVVLDPLGLVSNAVSVRIQGSDDLVKTVTPDPIAVQDYNVNEWGFEDPGLPATINIDELAVGDLNAFDPDTVLPAPTFGALGSRQGALPVGFVEVKGQYGVFILDQTTGKWSYNLKEFTPHRLGLGPIVSPDGVLALDDETLDWDLLVDGPDADTIPTNDIDFRNAEEIKGGDQRFENLTVFSTGPTQASAGASTTVTVTIQGYEDPALLTDVGATDKMTTERGGLNNNLPGDLNAGGNVKSTDSDIGDTGWQTLGGSIPGTYGTFTFTPNNPASTAAWTYVLNDTLPGVDGLLAGQSLTDTLALVSKDGTPQSIVVQINGVNDLATLVLSPGADLLVTEKGGVNNTVFNAGDENAGGTLVVTDPDNGQQQIAPPVLVNTIYGTFSINPTTGVWTYLLNDLAPATQALDPLIPMQASAIDSIVVYSVDNTASTTLSVTVIGRTDVANLVNTYEENALLAGTQFDNTVSAAGPSFDGISNGTVHIPPVLTAQNIPAGEGTADRTLFNLVPVASLTGTFGTWTFDDATFEAGNEGDWMYVLNPADPDYVALAPGQTQTDTLVVQETSTGGIFNINVNVVGVNEVPVITPSPTMTPTGSTTFTATDLDPGTLLRLLIDDIGAPSLAVRDLGAINNGTPTIYSVPPNPSSADMVIGPLYASDDGVNLDTPIGVGLGQGTTGGDNMVDLENAALIGALFAGYGGNDTIGGTAGKDYMDGGTESDTMRGNAGDDTMLGGAGNDTLDGGSDNDQLFGGSEDDMLDGDTGNDSLSGEGGNDDMDGDAGSDTLLGGGGDDIMDGDIDSDSMDGGTGNDTMNGGGQADSMAGGDDNDSMDGDGGADTMSGGNGADSMFGDGGADRMTGDAGNDTMDGGAGNDVVDGGADNDSLSGGVDQDTMIGGTGNDVLNDGVGADGSIDLFRGGAGNDTLVGDAGQLERDEFEFKLAGTADADVVNNFEYDTGGSTLLFGDRILLPNTWTGEPVGPNTNANPTWFKVLVSAPTDAAQDADDRLIYDQSTSKLYFDEDGSGVAFQPKLVVELAGLGATLDQLDDLTFLFVFIAP